MASIASYTTADGNRYRVRYRKRKSGFTTIRAADSFISRVEMSKLMACTSLRLVAQSQ